MQVERGPDQEKIKDMQESHGAGTVKYTGLKVFLTSKNNPLGREILVDTVYKVEVNTHLSFMIHNFIRKKGMQGKSETECKVTIHP